MIVLRIEEIYFVIWTCHVEDISVSITITNEFNTSKQNHAKYILQFVV
jgi:hypothetical protein